MPGLVTALKSGLERMVQAEEQDVLVVSKIQLKLL